MYRMQIILAQAQASQGNGMVANLILFGAIALIFYFFMIRPQQRKQKEHTLGNPMIDWFRGYGSFWQLFVLIRHFIYFCLFYIILFNLFFQLFGQTTAGILQ